MFSWISKNDDSSQAEVYDTVLDGLKKVYRTKLLPLEQAYHFHDFHSPHLEDADFEAKPMILLVGQYSTGKTTFIRYLLERDFPGIHIGPEPTTDRFIAVMYDEREGSVPGNALVVDPKKQFRPLDKFGNSFLNRFQCSLVNSPVLKGISIVDTPGILSGEKQRVDRGYDFTGVLEWFAERVDRIILLFDAHKLDISDEFRRSIEALRGHDDKIRIVLNKADMVDHQQLMRVYGALMWSLGKVLQTPEVARVYIGSFWDQPLVHDVNRRLFEDEEQDLFRDLQSLPRNAALRKLNDLIKRARLAKVQAYIIAALRKDMPSMFGKDGKKKELIKKLDEIYKQIQREYQISPGDFPKVEKMQELLQHHDFTKFQQLRPRLIEVVDKMLSEDIAHLMQQIPRDDEARVSAPPLLKGGAFDGVKDTVSPFGYKRGEGIDAGQGEPDWVVNKERHKYDSIFSSLSPVDGKVTGASAKAEMVKSKLPNSVLGKIWKLSDVDKDGFLDADEFALAMHLIQPCDTPIDFRAEQCAQFNGQLYNGLSVTWAPHIEAENPCALTCITQNGDIVTLNSRVQDGTRCTGGSLDMCINGGCQKVGCDLRIGSALTVDSCGVCGGDGSACRDQAAEYYYWTAVQASECSRSCGGGVARPKVQCRSRVTEEVVKDELCKVELRPRAPETECNTHPCAARWVSEPWGHCSVQCGKGIRSRKSHCAQDVDGVPTRIPNHHCSKHHKPKTQEPCFIQPCPPKWITQKWSPCSVQCGEGIQTRNVTCSEARADIECAHLEKPADVRTCSSEIQCDWNARTLELEYSFRNISTAEKLVGKISPSEPAWGADEWGECGAACGAGVRRRRVVCRIFLEFSRTFATLPDAECAGPKPVIEEKCLLGPCVAKNRWATGPWSNCSVPCGDGLKTRSVLCKTYLENARLLVTVPDDQCNEPKPVTRQRCMMPLCALEHKLEAAAFQDEEVKVVSGSKGSFTYSWRSEDYTQCSQSCLQGIQENIVMCIRDQDSRSVHPGLCDPKTRPEVITRTCNDFSCPPRWQTGEFQPCSKTCGLGIQLREVVCVHEVVRNSTSVVPNIQCPQPPPPDRQYCAVIDCPILWHTDKWSKCSRPCGGGVKTRKVECKQEMAQRHIVNRLPTQCPKHRPVDKRPCNTKPCASETARPFIATENSTFVQENPDQVKVHLKVGAHATVYYNTQLKIKCPVHQFDRSKIKWTKDGQVIRRGKNYKISKKGALKVVRATFQDNGVFTCRAGQSQADVTIVVKPKSGVFINSEELPHGDGSKADPPSPEAPPPRSRDFPNSVEPGKSRLRFDPEDSHEKNPTGGAGSTRSPYPETRRRKPSITSRPSRRPPTEDRDLNHENQTQNSSDGGAAKSGASRLVPNFHSLLSHLQTLWPFQSYNSVRGHQSRLTDESPWVRRDENQGPLQDSVDGAARTAEGDSTIRSGRNGQGLDEDANGGEINENWAKSDRNLVETEHTSSKSDQNHSFERNQDPMRENTDLPNGFSDDQIRDKQNVFLSPKATAEFRSDDLSGESESLTRSVGSSVDSLRSDVSRGTEDNQNGGGDAALPAGIFPFALAQTDGRYEGDEMGEEIVLGKGSRENLKFEWVLTEWSKCSQPCGGNGFRMRAAHCMAVVHNRSRSVDAALCTDAALSTPTTIEPCGTHYCPVWKTGLWNSCDAAQCFTWNTAIQTRTIWCEAENGTHLNDSYCEHDTTPLTRQECYNDLCKGVWRTGEWSECRARCEADGIKYRILQCVWYGTRRPAGNACRDQTRPSVMKTCRGGPCHPADGKCEDTSKYCRNVRKFNLCKQEQYRTQCCKSCRR